MKKIKLLLLIAPLFLVSCNTKTRALPLDWCVNESLSFIPKSERDYGYVYQGFKYVVSKNDQEAVAPYRIDIYHIEIVILSPTQIKYDFITSIVYDGRFYTKISEGEIVDIDVLYKADTSSLDFNIL